MNRINFFELKTLFTLRQLILILLMNNRRIVRLREKFSAKILFQISKMVFVYHGNVPELKQQVEESKWRINQAYLEIFGNEAYTKLERIVQRTLTPRSYIETVEGLRIVTKEELPETTPSKFMFATLMDLRIDKEGRIGNKNAIIGCGFYVTPKSFENSDGSRISDKIIASYVHEYNHFVPMVLQQTPLYLAHMYLTHEFGPVYGIRGLEKVLVEMQENTELPLEERRKRVLCSGMAAILFDAWEKSTRVLDKLVLEKIGINFELKFRGKPKQFMYHQSKELGLVTAVPYEGDPFRGLTDIEVIKRVVEWEKYFGTKVKYSYTENLFETLKQVKVEYVSFQELYDNKHDVKRLKNKDRRDRKREREKKRKKEDRS